MKKLLFLLSSSFASKLEKFDKLEIDPFDFSAVFESFPKLSWDVFLAQLGVKLAKLAPSKSLKKFFSSRIGLKTVLSM